MTAGASSRTSNRCRRAVRRWGQMMGSDPGLTPVGERGGGIGHHELAELGRPSSRLVEARGRSRCTPSRILETRRRWARRPVPAGVVRDQQAIRTPRCFSAVTRSRHCETVLASILSISIHAPFPGRLDAGFRSQSLWAWTQMKASGRTAPARGCRTAPVRPVCPRCARRWSARCERACGPRPGRAVRSISESGPASTPVLMKPGRIPVPSIPYSHSLIHRSAS